MVILSFGTAGRHSCLVDVFVTLTDCNGCDLCDQTDMHTPYINTHVQTAHISRNVSTDAILPFLASQGDTSDAWQVSTITGETTMPWGRGGHRSGL